MNKLLQIHDIASAVVYMHECDPPVVHGDLKAVSETKSLMVDD